MTPNEKELLTALERAGADASVTDILRRNDLPTDSKERKNFSSRLCELRVKGLAASYQQDGVNYWSLTEAGWKALGRDISLDIPVSETPPESPEIQPVEPDISADIPAPERADPLEYEPNGPNDIHPALVQESVRIRPVAPFARINDALFVLDTLTIAYCRGMPAYQEELGRIADYLREAAA